MQYPQNYETARSLENIIREKGVVPATIAILEGKIHVGLTDDQIHSLSQ